MVSVSLCFGLEVSLGIQHGCIFYRFLRCISIVVSNTCAYCLHIVEHGGSVVGFGAFCPENRRFESHSNGLVRTLGKSFTCSCL